MIITYLIGNGMDKALGLKTGYDDFYKYLKNNYTDDKGYLKGYPYISIDEFATFNKDKQRINWADLEVKLGEITEKFESADEFIEFYNELTEIFTEYIKNQENQIMKYKDTFTDVSCNLSYNELIKYILPKDKIKYIRTR